MDELPLENVVLTLSGHYACQQKAWMDGEMMNKWIDLVLIPWWNTEVPGIIPLLILGDYCIHIMGNIMNQIKSRGIEVFHIPVYCMYLCQPVHVGTNKSIKTGMKEKWVNWVVGGEGNVKGAAKEPSQKLVTEWLLDVYRNLPGQT